MVGEDGFGPSKLKSNRFTVCPLWPLGNSPIEKVNSVSRQNNGAGGRTRTPDLLITNQLLYQLSYTSLFKTSFLTTYLLYHSFFDLSSVFWKFFKKFFWIRMVEATGLEPAASCSQSKHSTKLSYASDHLRSTNPWRSAFILYQNASWLSSYDNTICNFTQ